jgi:flagellar hook protein FlgE
MLGTIYIGMSGMNAYSKGLDVISNNVANLNTPGFKLTVPSFSDQLYRNSGGAIAGTAGAPTGGAGVAVSTDEPSFRQGDLRDTGNTMDAAVDGNGFFVIEKNGQRLYTRAGQFQFNDDGTLVDRSTGGAVLVNTGGTTETTFNVNESRVFEPRATTEVKLAGTLARTSTNTFEFPSISVNDTTGSVQLLKAKLTRSDSNPLLWTAEISNADTTIIGTGIVTFNDNGTPAEGANTFKITVTPKSSAAFDVTFNMGNPGSYAGVNSPASSTGSQLSVLKQDGLQIGTLTQTSFDDTGHVVLTYSNGQTRTPAALLLAQFDSADRLQALGDALFAVKDGSSAVLATAQTQGRGRVVSGKLELSNVDLTQQFTDLIIIQRGYQASSQMTSVANEMIQQLLSMGQQK